MRLPWLLPAVHRPTRRPALPRGARPLPGASRTSRWTAAAWDALQIPVGLAFFFRNSALDRTVAFYPGPGRCHRVRAGPGRLERSSRRRSAGRPAGRRRRGAAGAGARTTSATAARVCHLVPIDACYEFVGRLRMLWRGFDGGSRTRAATSTTSSPTVADAQQGGRMTWPMTEVTFAVLDVAPEPYAVTPSSDRAGRHRRGRRRTGPRDRAALPGAHRAAAAPLLRRRGRGAARPVRRPRALGHHPAHLPVAALAPRWCRVSPAPPRSTCRWRAPTTSRWPPRSTCTRCATAPSRCSSCSAEPSSPQGDQRLRRRSRCRGTARTVTTCRCRSGATSSRQHFPNTGWVRLDHDTVDRAGRLQVRARPAVGRRGHLRVCSPRASEDVR